MESKVVECLQVTRRVGAHGHAYRKSRSSRVRLKADTTRASWVRLKPDTTGTGTKFADLVKSGNYRGGNHIRAGLTLGRIRSYGPIL